MADFDQITRIRVGKNQVGIRGLAAVIEETAEAFENRPESEVAEELLTRLSAGNYIPESVREAYGTAFLSEYRKKKGLPASPDEAGGIEIKVLGPGCALCDQLEGEIMALLSELDIAADFEHIREMKEIAAYGVMGMPALLINGKVMCAGKNPRKGKLVQWLRQAAESS